MASRHGAPLRFDSLRDTLERLGNEPSPRHLEEMKAGWALKRGDRESRIARFGSFNRGIAGAEVEPNLAADYLTIVRQAQQRLDEIFVPLFEAVDRCQVSPSTYCVRRFGPAVIAILTTLTLPQAWAR